MKPLIVLNKNTTCCFSGYRPEKLPWGTMEDDPRCEDLKQRIAQAVTKLYNEDMRHFICGMARGCDTYFCETVLELRQTHTDITVEAAIPCEAQAAKWSEPERNRYFSLIEQCDAETYVSRRYTRECMIERNKYMVDCSAVLLAVFDGQFGGTMQTIEYARRSGLKIVKLEP